MMSTRHKFTFCAAETSQERSYAQLQSSQPHRLFCLYFFWTEFNFLFNFFPLDNYIPKCLLQRQLTMMDDTDLPPSSHSGQGQEGDCVKPAPITIVASNGCDLIQLEVEKDTLTEILSHIFSFSFLDQECLGTCRQVCKLWNEVVTSRCYSQRVVTFGLFGKEFQNDAERRLASQRFAEEGPSAWSPEIMKDLIVSLEHNVLQLRESRGWMEALAPNLTMLEINGPFIASMVAKVLDMCPSLNSLTLYNFKPYEGDVQSQQEGRILQQHCKQLPLKLKEVGLSCLDKLDQERWARNWRWGDSGSHALFLIDLIAESPNLELLVLEFELRSFIENANRLGLKPHCLQQLYLHEEIDILDLAFLVKWFPKLTVFQFQLNMQRRKGLLPLKAAIRQLMNLRQLEKLRVELVSGVTMPSIEFQESFEDVNRHSFLMMGSLAIVSQLNQEILMETILQPLTKPPHLVELELVNFCIRAPSQRVEAIRNMLRRSRGIDFLQSEDDSLRKKSRKRLAKRKL